MIPTVLEKEHSKLGEDVKVAVVDLLGSSEAMVAIIEPPRKISVTNITEEGFQNERALSMYFKSPQRSSGGEIDEVVYHGQGRASVTFRDYSG